MFFKILFFELRYKFKQSFTYIFWVMLFFQGLWYLGSMDNLYYNDKAFVNSGANMYIILASLGIIGIILAAINTSQALYKDVEHHFASIVYTSRIKEGTLFWSRFASTLVANFFIFSGFVAGLIMLPFMGLGEPTDYGPTPWVQIGNAVLIFLIPNLFSIVAIAYSFTVFLRSAGGAYLAAFLYMAGMVFAESTRETAANKDLLFLVDPFGFAFILDKFENLGALEKNNYLMPVETVILYSRMIWIGIGTVMLLIARWKFSFRYFITKVQPKSKSAPDNSPPLSTSRGAVLPRVLPVFSDRSNLLRMFRLSWLEAKTVMRSWSFLLIVVLIGMMFVGYNLIWTEQYYSRTSQLPLTYLMTYIRKPVGFMLIIIMMVYAGEMFYKDRTANTWQIMDALPVPRWVTVLSRFAAMGLLCLLFSSLFILSGVIAQVSRGFFQFEWWLYFYDIILLSWPKYLVAVSLALFTGALVTNRYIGHTLCLAFFIFIIVVHEMEITNQTRFQFMLTPGFEYSDLNRHGQYLLSEFWFLAYWTVLAAAMVTLATIIWHRGILSKLGKRLQQGLGKQNRWAIGLLIFFLGGFFACHQVIYHNINQVNKFQTVAEERAEAAAYERKYKRFEDYPQPQITELNLDLELYPEKRTAVYTAAVWLKNKSAAAIDTLHLEYKDFSTIRKIGEEGEALILISKDEDFRHNMYRLRTPLLPGDSLLLHFDMKLAYQGFAEHTVDQNDLVYNGTLLGTEILPFFGYNRERELKEHKYRAEMHLPKESEALPEAEDPLALSGHFVSGQADHLRYTMTISTSAGQRVATAGKLTRSWQKDGRNYFQYTSEGKGLYNFYIASARYDVRKTTWVDTLTKRKVAIEVFYHPTHHLNIGYFVQSIENMLAYGSKNFGPYPYSVLRVIETPVYSGETHVFDNAITIPENQAWSADNRKTDDVDYIHYLSSQLLSRQWFMQADLRRAKGFPVVTRALSGYVALSMFEEKYGSAILKGHLKKRTENYIKGRGREANIEPALLHTGESDYVAEDKGGMVLFTLSKLMGAAKLNKVIRTFIDETMTYNKAPYPDAKNFYEALKKETPDSLRSILEDGFEKRILYDNSVVSVAIKHGNTFETTVELGVKKWVDEKGDGNQTEVTRLHEWVPVQLFDQNGDEIYSGFHLVTRPLSTLRIKTTTKPAVAAADAYGYLIDTNAGNNRKSIPSKAL